MTLDEFLAQKQVRNAHVEHPDFTSFYVRNGSIVLFEDDAMWRCTKLLQIGAIEAAQPGTGAFRRLVDDLVARGLAIFVENVHNPLFRDKLVHMGFVSINPMTGSHYLFNHEGHLEPVEGFNQKVCTDKV